MTEQILLAPSTEIMNAMLFSDIDAATAQRVSTEGVDFHGALKSQLDIELSDDINVDFVANSGNEVNLILPYYESIEAERSRMISDGEIEDVAGGEIVGLVFLGAAIGSGIVIAANIGGGTVTAAIIGSVVGGIIGGAVGVGLAGVYIAGATGAFDGGGGIPEGYSGPGYSELARAAKTGNSLLGI